MYVLVSSCNIIWKYVQWNREFNVYQNRNRIESKASENFCRTNFDFLFFSNFHDSVRPNRIRVESLFCIESIESKALFGQIASSIRIMKIWFCFAVLFESNRSEVNRVEINWNESNSECALNSRVSLYAYKVER